MSVFTQSYYDDITGRLRSILILVADNLPDSTYEVALRADPGLDDWNEAFNALRPIVETVKVLKP